MPGKPFQSKLTPHFELIAMMRRQRQSWQEIADHLATLGTKTDKGSVCAFFKRHRSRPAPLGMEPALAAGRFESRAKSSAKLPNLPELPPPPSEFEADPLTLSTKKKWGIVPPN